MRESVATKAHRYLREARLNIVEVTDHRIEATCRGEEMYACGWSPADGWWCACPAFARRCCHLVALRLVCIRQRGAA